MSRPSRDWWSYVKGMIRRYHTKNVTEDEKRAVRAAIRNTKKLPDGAERLEVIRLVFWLRHDTLAGAAMKIPCSYETAQQWHADFIREVACNFKCSGLK